ncbi:uncharacterized protein [Haliotis asinina]|uniref:uncharacterized protein n=1 Tax=Haliotis asinina TaxID=109174 RepID=UPI003531F7DF
MLLSIPGLMVTLSCIVVRDRTLVKAANIMLGKPSRLSTTYSAGYLSGNANDGNRTGDLARSTYQLHPFWQGDLQGYFTVHNITVTRDNSCAFVVSVAISNAYIGVSSVDVDCPDDDVTWCGQWSADESAGVTLTYSCTHGQPVRFVRVWRNTTGYLGVREVEVQGTPSRNHAARYTKSQNKKLSTPVTEVNARSAIHCAIKCHVTQPCLGFSYNPSGDPPCLMATSTETTPVTSWVTGSISACNDVIY